MHNAIIIPVIFLSAVLSGAFSMGGGVLALTAFAAVLNPAALIPVHGMVQFSSNLSRTIMARQYIRKRTVLLFALGTVLGAGTGRFFLPELPPKAAEVLFAAGILFFTWKPRSPVRERKKNKGNYILAGGLAGYISLFMGVSGPVIAPFFLQDDYNKREIVATKSACQCFTHACKLGVFLSWGRLDTAMLHTALLFIPFVLAGNWIGQQLLGKLPERVFLLLIKIVISILTLRMLYKAFY